MKLRITEDTIRLRLSEQECDELSRTKQLTNTCYFPAGNALIYSLKITDKLDVSLQENHIKISVTNDQGQILLQKGMVSTSFDHKNKVTHLIVEQDLKS